MGKILKNKAVLIILAVIVLVFIFVILASNDSTLLVKQTTDLCKQCLII